MKSLPCRWIVGLVVAAPLLFGAVSASAAPPAYLVLRRVESPGPRHRPGHADAAMYDARTSGYAYGYFGAAPRTHASRHFGYHRVYKQWSWW
jgi:hypothetical protein